jgi:hypothetical protein
LTCGDARCLETLDFADQITDAPGDTHRSGAVPSKVKDLPSGTADDVTARPVAAMWVKPLNGSHCTDAGLLDQIIQIVRSA